MSSGNRESIEGGVMPRWSAILESSRRITTSGGWVPEVDGVRFVAITLVLLQHVHERVLRRTGDLYGNVTGSFIDQILLQGNVGVLIFFTLSGYILGMGLIPPLDRGAGVPWKAFYLRRLTRLEPPYVLVMVAIYGYVSLIGHDGAHAKSFHEGASSLGAALGASLVYCYGFIYGTLPKLNPPAWSLEIEVQFYLLMPLLAWLISRFSVRGRVTWLMVVMVLWSSLVTPLAAANPHTKYSLLTMFPYFVVGLIAVDLNRWASAACGRSRAVEIVMGASAMGALAFLTVGRAFLGGGAATATASTALGTGIFLLCGMNGWGIRKVLAFPLISVAGGMCYSIYLIHLPVLEVAANVSTRYGTSLPYPAFFGVQFICLSGIVGVLSWLLFRLVERPCMDREWPAKLWMRLSGAVKPPTAAAP